MKIEKQQNYPTTLVLGIVDELLNITEAEGGCISAETPNDSRTYRRDLYVDPGILSGIAEGVTRCENGLIVFTTKNGLVEMQCRAGKCMANKKGFRLEVPVPEVKVV